MRSAYAERMSTRPETIEFLSDQLSALPTFRTRAMFGEYGVYLDDKVVGFVCDDDLFLKPTEEAREALGEVDEAPPYPGAKMYFRIRADQWEAREWLADIVMLTASVLPEPKPKKPRVRKLKA